MVVKVVCADSMCISRCRISDYEDFSFPERLLEVAEIRFEEAAGKQ